MAESFEKLNNILHNWAKDKVQKSLVKALNMYRCMRRMKKKEEAISLLENGSEQDSSRQQSSETFFRLKFHKCT